MGRKKLSKPEVVVEKPVVKKRKYPSVRSKGFSKDEKIIKQEVPEDLQVAVRDYVRAAEGGKRSQILKALDATSFDLTSYLRVTEKQKSAFLTTLIAKGNLKDAAEAVGIDPVDAYNLRRTDVEFALKFQIAMELYYDSLEGIIRDKIMTGDDKWSALLLMFTLKGGRPKYKEESKYVSTGGGDINVYNSPIAGMSEEELLKIAGKKDPMLTTTVDGEGEIE